MKGEVDDLSWDVAAVTRLMKKVPDLSKDLHYLIKGNYTPEYPDAAKLIDDPHSIPINRPQDASAMVKNYVSNALPHITKNGWMKDVLNMASVSRTASVKQTLAHMRPLMPQIMHDIFKKTIQGVASDLADRFTMTRTLSKTIGVPSIQRAVVKTNISLLYYIRQRYTLANRSGTFYRETSPYATCSKLRDLWKCDLTNSSIGVYTPFEFELDTVQPAGTAQISAMTRTKNKNFLTEIGDYPPNFGTRTRQKISHHGYKIVSSSSTVKDLKDLTMIYSELGSSKDLGEVLDVLIEERCPWTIEYLSTIMPTSIGGTAAHRHQALGRSAFAVLGSKTVPTHLNFCSDDSGILSGGKHDYPIVFQAMYLTLTGIHQSLSECMDDDDMLSLSLILTDDYEPIPDTAIVRDPRYPLIKPQNNRAINPLCYITGLQMQGTPQTPNPKYFKVINSIKNNQSRSLVYSYLMHNVFHSVFDEVYLAEVNMPNEFLDMKEFLTIPIDDLIDGISWFITTIAIYDALKISGDRSLISKFNQGVNQAARNIALKLSRNLLHSSQLSKQYCIDNDIELLPGEHGAQRSVAHFTGLLASRAREAFLYRTMVSSKCELYLFPDSTKTDNHVLFAHFLSHIIQQNPNPGFVINGNDYRTLKNVLITYDTVMTPGYVQAQRYAASYNIIHILHLRGSQYKMMFEVPVVAYMNMDSKEAIRLLRAVQPVKRKDIDPPKLRFDRPNQRNGVVTYSTNETITGSVTPRCKCKREELTMMQRFRQFLTRPYGIHSSVTSIWMDYFFLRKHLIIRKNVVSLGVGHGAVATSALYHGANLVEGIDKRSQFPKIAQREGTYYPPEIVTHSMINKFCWSPFVWRKGGEALVSNMEDWYTNPDDPLIIDIDSDYQSIRDIVLRVKAKTLIVKFHACNHWIRQAISELRPIEIISPDPDQLASNVYIIHTSHSRVLKHSTFLETTNVNIPGWLTNQRTDASHGIRLVNQVIRPTGYTVSGLSSKHLGEVTTKLKSNLKCVKPRQYATHREHYEAMVGLTKAIRQQPTVSEMLLMSLSKGGLRLVARVLANMSQNPWTVVVNT
jgi:hypothetical protein